VLHSTSRDSHPKASLLAGLVAHLDDAGVGSISEVFNAEPPFAPRGCIAQAWGVAELLRAWRMI
jgi:glycogen debranching enzyme